MQEPRISTKFLVDAMLGSLARKLRAFGFDATYYREGGDDGIIRAARSERRVVLTSDKSLYARMQSERIPSFLLSGHTDGQRIASLLRSAKRERVVLKRGEPLCSLCGGPLEQLDRNSASPLVPHPVARRHRLFYLCGTCGKIYWRGGHWKKLRRLERGFGHRVRHP
jgi:hypothetical protein